jgi:ornithine carbamoyltransferase
MEKAFKGADVIYAKSWGAMLTTEDAEQGAKIISKYKHWITDSRKMSMAKDDAIYMHPLPADRDVEVTSEVMDGPNSVVFDQAENRLHAQKAVMALTMS